jgi:C4-type Zn-finger protein
MAETRECPMCGESMRLEEHESTDRIPGRPQLVKRTNREWVCSGCDYYEEQEEGATRGEPGREER